MEYKKLNEVEFVETTSENTNMIIEEDGVIKRCPKPLDLIHTAIIRHKDYLQEYSEFVPEFECLNMTFDEAKEIVMSGGVLLMLMQIGDIGSPQMYYMNYEFETSYNEFIITAWEIENPSVGQGTRQVLYWRDNGFVMFM